MKRFLLSLATAVVTLSGAMAGVPVNSYYGNLGSTYYIVEGDAIRETITEKYFKSDQLSAIPSDEGIACIKVTFKSGVLPDKSNTTAKITLTRAGDATPLLDMATDEQLDGEHLWWGTTPKPKVSDKGNTPTSVQKTWGIYYNVTEQIGYTNKETHTDYYMYYVPEFLKTPGAYTLHIDEGYFLDKNGDPNDEVNIYFTILGMDLKTTVAPESDTTVESLKDITVTYPEGAVVSVPEGATVKLGYLQPLSDTELALLPEFAVSGAGNVVTLSVNEPFALPDKYNYVLNIPGSLWNVTYQGQTEGNRPIGLKYYINSVAQGTVVPAPTAEGECIMSFDLEKIVYNSVLNISLNEEDAIGSAYLYRIDGDTRTQAVTYTGVATGQKAITWTASDDVTALASGNYEFEIPAASVTYSGLKSPVTATKAFVYNYEVKESQLFANFFTLTQPASTELFDNQLGADGLSTMGFEYSDTKLVKSDDPNIKITLSHDGTTICEIPANSAALEEDEPMEFGGNVLEGSLYIYFAEINDDFDYRTVGTYKLTIPNGLYSYEGEPIAGASYSITVNKKPIDFSYTLDPEPGETDNLSEITLTFTKATDLNYASNSTNPVATLSNADGTQVLDCVYPGIDFNNHTLKFTFGDEDTEWVNGAEYTLTVHKGTIALDDPQFDDSVIGSGNFEGLTVKYILTGGTPADEAEELADYLILQTPSTLEANPTNTRFGSWGVVGMGVTAYTIKANPKEFRGVEGADFISIRYSATEDGEKEVLASFSPVNENNVSIYGSGLFADDDFPTAQESYSTLMLLFCNDGDGGINYDELPMYMKDGYYSIEIPDGAFELVKADGSVTKLNGLTLTYHYTNSAAPVQTNYVLTPADGENVQDPGAVFGYKGSGIVLEFPNANFVDINQKAATLTTPENVVMSKNVPSGAYTNKLTWTFGGPNDVWPAKGTYTFTIKPGYIYIDMGFEDDYDEVGVGNFPGLTAIYHAGEITGIVMYGVEQADSYSVYSIDGKIVKLNANPDDMLDLQPGIYIINGKKAIVRK